MRLRWKIVLLFPLLFLLAVSIAGLAIAGLLYFECSEPGPAPPPPFFQQEAGFSSNSSDVVFFSPDSYHLAFAADNVIFVYEVRVNGLVQVFAHEAKGTLNHGGVAFSPDSRRLAFSTLDRVVICEVPETGGVKVTVDSPSHGGRVAFTNESDRLLVSESKTLQILDVRNGAVLNTIEIGDHAITRIVTSPVDDGVWVACGEYGFKHFQLGTPTSQKFSLGSPPKAFPPDGRYFATYEGFGVVYVLRTSDLTKSQTLHNVSSGVAFDPTGEKLAFGGSDGRCHIWSLKDDKEIDSWSPRSQISAIAYHPSGDIVVLCRHPSCWRGSNGETLTVYSPKGRRRNSFRAFNSLTSAPALSPDGKYVAILGNEQGHKLLRVWEWGQVAGK